MQDINKKKRSSLWFMVVICLITIPVVFYFDNNLISEDELVAINNLTLSKQPDYNGGKRPRINIYVTNTQRTLVVNHEELSCVDNDEVLKNFNTGEVISVKIFREDADEFYKTGTISRFQKIYGLKKNGKEYIELSCRNAEKERMTYAFIYAGCATAVLSFILAIFFYKPSTKETGWLMKIDPLLIVSVFWFIVMIIFR